VAVDARFLECLFIRLKIAVASWILSSSDFFPAVTYEEELDVFFEAFSVLHVFHRDGAATEESDVGELVEVPERNCFCLHAVHGKTGHGSVWLIGQSAKIGIARNLFFGKYRFEMADIEVSYSARPHIIRHDEAACRPDRATRVPAIQLLHSN